MVHIKTLEADIAKLKTILAKATTPAATKEKIKDKLKTLQQDLRDAKKKAGAPKANSNIALTALSQARRDAQKGVPKGKSDIEKDARRPAKKAGKRITDGTHFPYKKGNVYYEKRDNRTDHRQPANKYKKLKAGGMLEAGAMVHLNTPINGFSEGEYELVKEYEGTALIPQGSYLIKNKEGKTIKLKKDSFSEKKKAGGEVNNGKAKFEKGDEGMFEGGVYRVLNFDGTKYHLIELDDANHIEISGSNITVSNDKFERQYALYPKMKAGGELSGCFVSHDGGVHRIEK
jgi:hypothetical protein